MLREIFAYLMGGRPMTKQGFMFMNEVAGTPVYIFQDYYGRQWLAEHRWALFRVAPLFKWKFTKDGRPYLTN